MKMPTPQNSTDEFFENLEKEGRIETLPDLTPQERAESNALLEKYRRELVEKARRSEISAAKVILNS
jgi:hypothetical protein